MAEIENNVSLAGVVSRVDFSYTPTGIPHLKLQLEMPFEDGTFQRTRKMTVEAWRDVAEQSAGVAEGSNVRAYGYLDTRNYQAKVYVDHQVVKDAQGKDVMAWRNESSLTADLIEVLS